MNAPSVSAYSFNIPGRDEERRKREQARDREREPYGSRRGRNASPTSRCALTGRSPARR
jgi:hypothetical protein